VSEPRPGRARRWDRRRLFIAAAAGWAVLLVAVGIVSAHRDRPTWKDQTTLAQAHRTLDAATGELARAAGTDVVLALGGYEVRAGCRITPVRDGTAVQRAVRLFTPAGTETALLAKLAAGLPAGYQAEGPDRAGKTLYADAGTFVAVRGGPGDPGEVRLRVSTDCRPGADPTLTDAARTDPPVPDAGRAPVERALALLGATAQRWHAYSAPCPGGGQVGTVEAIGAAAPKAPPLSAALAKHPGRTVVAEPQRYAYRDGAVGVAVRAAGDTLTVTATTPCGAQ
jgi:hypothetical protein